MTRLLSGTDALLVLCDWNEGHFIWHQRCVTAIYIQCFLCTISDSDISEVPDGDRVLWIKWLQHTQRFPVFTEGKCTVCLISMLHSGSLEKRPRCSGWVRVHLWVFNEQQQLKGNETEKSSEERTNQWGLFNWRKHAYSTQFNFIYMASVARASLGALQKPMAWPLNKNCLWKKEKAITSLPDSRGTGLHCSCIQSFITSFNSITRTVFWDIYCTRHLTVQ